MLSLLAPLLGIIGSIIPSIVRIFEKQQDLRHEIELTKLKMDAAALQSQNTLDIEAIKAVVAEGQSLRDHDRSLDGGKFINALRASIRPVITYLFFLLFVVIKLVALLTMVATGQPIPEMLDAIWDIETMSLFSTIVAFWFGSRIFEKREQYRNPSIKTSKR